MVGIVVLSSHSTRMIIAPAVDLPYFLNFILQGQSRGFSCRSDYLLPWLLLLCVLVLLLLFIGFLLTPVVSIIAYLFLHKTSSVMDLPM